MDIIKETHRAMRRPLSQGSYPANKEYWQPKLSEWMKSLAKFVFPKQVEVDYPPGGTVSEAMDWILSAGLTPGYGNIRRATSMREVQHSPLLEPASPEPEVRATAEEPGFQDFLYRMSTMAVFRTADGYLVMGGEHMTPDLIPMVLR